MKPSALPPWRTLAVGGWIGGSIVCVHGMRVLSLPEPAARAVAPGGKQKAEEEAG